MTWIQVIIPPLGMMTLIQVINYISIRYDDLNSGHQLYKILMEVWLMTRIHVIIPNGDIVDDLNWVMYLFSIIIIPNGGMVDGDIVDDLNSGHQLYLH